MPSTGFGRDRHSDRSDLRLTMTAILGISGFYHDSAAALVVDGKIVAAAQEERFTRIKHDPGFPQQAIDYCLNEAGLAPGDLDYVGFYDKPLLKFDRLLHTYLAYAPVGFHSFTKAIPQWLKQKLHLPRELRRELKGEYRKRFVFPEHHESHAASAFFPSPFEEAAILTVDGVGEWATATIGIGRGHRIELTHELRFPHSLGMLYTAFTYFCGFRVNSGEYKLMGLAPYGEPKYAELIREKLLDLKEDGSFRMEMSYFNYCQGLTMTSPKLHRLFGGPPRRPESPITQREMDVAASIQAVTEEIMLRMARWTQRQTGMNRLCLAGGVALNCVANGRILREGPFEELWIQPAAGDAGGALGTALFIWHQLLEKPRRPQSPDAQRGSLLGPAYSDEEVRACLDGHQAMYSVCNNGEELCERVAGLLAEGNVVGWMQGRMEFGPRALGNRSILGDPRSPEMQARMNLKIKFRESFRPFAPAVLRERASEYFELDQESPYMLLVADVTEQHRLSCTPPELTGLDRRKLVLSDVPAITHVDHSARVQTVDAGRNPRFHRLLSAFERQTGCPLLINTSFNIRGEPIVCTPEDAYRCFLATNMDVLVIGNHILLKRDQPDVPEHEADEYLAQFELD
jgi:carbamoyltransferase